MAKIVNLYRGGDEVVCRKSCFLDSLGEANPDLLETTLVLGRAYFRGSHIKYPIRHGLGDGLATDLHQSELVPA